MWWECDWCLTIFWMMYRIDNMNIVENLQHTWIDKGRICRIDPAGRVRCAGPRAAKGGSSSASKKYYGTDVYTRGLIEFTNYCRNDCYYCGIRNGNRNAQRYRLTKEEILDCCANGYELGFRTFVLQGGEDPYYTDEKLVEIVREIRVLYPECAITLSVGEHSKETYRLWKEAGADRYLLRHETASDELYQKLHPTEMKLSERKQCLYDLKELGYQVGAGFR